MFTAVAPAMTAVICNEAQNRYFGTRSPIAPLTSRIPVKCKNHYRSNDLGKLLDHSARTD